jgi:cytochrome c oxidase cbb3-type subunit II
MDRGMVLFLGCLLTFTSSWLGLVFAPLVKVNQQEPFVVDEATNDVYPKPMQGIVAEGFAVYKANGCIYCHSQQVREETFGNNTDILRGWGTRRTVARDYMYDRPIMLGTGPDLSNIGARNPSADWHLKHLWMPRSMTAGSIMPPFEFLFETRKIDGQPSVDALNYGEEQEKLIPKGYEVVPNSQGKALVQFLLWLNRSTVELPEAK